MQTITYHNNEMQSEETKKCSTSKHTRITQILQATSSTWFYVDCSLNFAGPVSSTEGHRCQLLLVLSSSYQSQCNTTASDRL